MNEFTIKLKIATDGDADELRNLLIDYLTSKEAPLWDDYGKGWGGYEGPFIREIEAVDE